MKTILTFFATTLMTVCANASAIIDDFTVGVEYNYPGVWAGNWFNQGEMNKDVSEYDYVFIKYSGLTGKIGFGIVYSEWQKKYSWGNVFYTDAVVMSEEAGIVGIALEKTKTYAVGVDNAENEFKGDIYAKHVRQVFLQDQGVASTIKVEGIWYGTEAEFEELKIAYSDSDSNPIPKPSDLHYVDLGLPSGTLWANMNIGANAISDFGDYFAWGEVSPKNNYSSKTYKYFKSETINDSTYIDDDGFTVEVKGGTYGGFTKYVFQRDAKNYGYKGFYDNLTRLDNEDDAAFCNWGKDWRMPTRQQFSELIDNCTWTWATISGIEGYKVTGNNGNYIFFPAAGYRENDNPYHPGEIFYDTEDSYGGKIGVYLSCDLDFWSDNANSLSIGFYIVSIRYSNAPQLVNGQNSGYRFRGHSIRPIYIGNNAFSLAITASGYGSAAYNGTSVRNQTQTFTVNEGASATITFTPDNGYRIASVKVNNTDVTANVSNNQYTVENIAANTTVDVTFEKNSSHALIIIASGNGIVTYNKISTRNQTQAFSVKEGTSATITFTPDNGYRIASVKVNNMDVTSSVVNNQYTVNNITANTTVAVIFEQIPVTTYSLSIKATGNGSAIYNGTTIRNQTQTFTVNEGTSATIVFTPDNGYRIASVKVNNTDVTASVNNSRYTVNNITANTTVAVTFEAIPPTTYTLSVSATGNGSAIYNGTTTRNQTQTFTVNEGTSATITFTPDNGYRIASVKVNNTDVTASVTDAKYTVSNIMVNTTVAATFEEEIRAMTVNGVNYTVTSTANRTVNVARSDYGQVLTVPSSFTYQGQQWQVTGMDADALSSNSELAAVIWNPSVTFPASISNPNFLLYVTAQQYAPASIGNVVVNGRASSITLRDVASGNNFYCPQEFTATNISYAHSYSMTTGIGTAQGWETIALPFDVQSISHPTKGTLVPFAVWSGESSTKPFWLYQLGGNGFVEASSIAANTPYIISMPNNQAYRDEYNVVGTITFTASNVSVKSSDQLLTATYGDRAFVPNYTNRAASNSYYVLNAVNDIAGDNGGYADGSMFIRGLRAVHPFEAYLTVSGGSAKAAIPVFEDATTRIRGVEVLIEAGRRTYVYNLNGQVVSIDGSTEGLAPGIYIVNGHKVVIK